MNTIYPNKKQQNTQIPLLKLHEKWMKVIVILRKFVTHFVSQFKKMRGEKYWPKPESYAFMIFRLKLSEPFRKHSKVTKLMKVKMSLAPP